MQMCSLKVKSEKKNLTGQLGGQLMTKPIKCKQYAFLEGGHLGSMQPFLICVFTYIFSTSFIF